MDLLPTPAGRRRASATRPLRMPAITVAVVALAMVGTLVGLRAARAGTALPGTTVAGVDVGGLDAEALRTAVERIDDAQQARPVEVRRGEASVVSTAGELGYAVDVDATVAAVMARGRQANPLLALRDQVRASFDPARVPATERVDPAAFDRWVARIAEELALPPIEGDLRITGGLVEVVEPAPGQTIDVTALRQMAVQALDGPGPIVLEVPTVLSTPTTSPEDLQRVAAEAQRAITGPVTLTRGDVGLTLTGRQIAELLEVRVPAVSGEAGTAADGATGRTLELAIDADALEAMVAPDLLRALEVPPHDATFEAVGNGVRVVPAVDGFSFDAEAAASQVLALATAAAGPRMAELDGDTVPPTFTTADARALGIVEQVATFTTEHPCCQPRVTNIHRIADIVDGTIVRPGETFSLNELVGPRTTEGGFVGGGAISGGEFVEQVGGGVSQFTTTLFNAIFFGGYQIDEFKPHSYYISRYPEGREATLNYSPPVDLKFTNDSPHGIYISTAYSDTAITVSLWSTTFAEVSTTTSPRYGFREPTEQREETDELPVGEERVVQSGRQGFSVDVTRTITYVDGRTVERGFTTTYLPEPRIIEVGTATADDLEASEAPSEDAGQDGQDGADDADGADATPNAEPTPAPQPDLGEVPEGGQPDDAEDPTEAPA